MSPHSILRLKRGISVANILEKMVFSNLPPRFHLWNHWYSLWNAGPFVINLQPAMEEVPPWPAWKPYFLAEMGVSPVESWPHGSDLLLALWRSPLASHPLLRKLCHDATHKDRGDSEILQLLQTLACACCI